MTRPWILLVEDDPIFSLLFSRSWKAVRPDVPLLTVTTLAEMRKLVEDGPESPSLVIFDQNLPDGNGHAAAQRLPMMTYCWSALSEGGLNSKPRGKPALEAAVLTLASLAGL